jgi:Tfp pilus assembly protein PilX
MFGDYPKRGRRLWLFLAVVVVLGLIGTALMLHSVSQG